MSLTAMQKHDLYTGEWYYDGAWYAKHPLDTEYEKPDPDPVFNPEDWCPICNEQTGSLYLEQDGKWTIECMECGELHASGLVDE